jgi:Na+/proline symporter/signal transduction histidine kinase/CheY-like chemotaxis protein
MTPGWLLIGLALAYVGALFALAWLGDTVSRRRARTGQTKVGRPFLYACSIGVFCTSWTFFGSVGLAANSGYNFLPVYLGAIIAFALCSPLIQHIVRVAKSQNLTSVADFISARYGKSQGVAATAAIIAVIGTLPYIALQLKAVIFSVDLVLGPGALAKLPLPIDPALGVAILLAVFSIMFGTRHIAVTEHQDGMMLAVAVESIIKLVAFLAVGLFIAMQAFGTSGNFLAAIKTNPVLQQQFAQGIYWPTWITVTVLSFCAILLLPRQFHVTVVENKDPSEIKTAAWLFPLYLVAINLFVVPIAAAGLLALPKGTPADTFVLALPQLFNAQHMVMIAFIGGLSAATAMVIVDSIALAIMVSNGIVVPLMVKLRQSSASGTDISQRLLMIRRFAIFFIVLHGYLCYRLLASSQGLAGIGLVAFAAIAQLAPAFFAAFFWRSGTASGAMAGMLVGFVVWAYTLIVPWIVDAGLLPQSLMSSGPFGLSFLSPRALFGVVLDPLPHGVLWSLSANILTFTFVSLQRYPNAAERLQAEAFAFGSHLRPPHDRIAERPGTAIPVTVTAAELWGTVTRFLGADRAQRSLETFQVRHQIRVDQSAQADGAQLRYAEYLLSSAVGAASSRLIMTLLLLRRGDVKEPEAITLLDALPQALQFNRDLLQTALDQVRDGIAVFDQSMNLTSWNKQFRELLVLAPQYGQVGMPLESILRVLAVQKGLNDTGRAAFVKDRFARLVSSGDVFHDTVDNGKRVIEMRAAPMPQGGLVATFADVTERWAADAAMKRVNADLETRVLHRTNAVTLANQKLLIETQRANEANRDKTRFLAAVSHDVMQPLHAARLYSQSLLDRISDEEMIRINASVMTSLDAVDEILTAVMDIARMDNGRMQPELTTFPLNDVFDQLRVEFAPIASARGLSLTIMKTSLWVRSDRRMLRRVLQNLVSNAIKYSRRGGVAVGARRRGATPASVRGLSQNLSQVLLQVTDTGTGIPADMREAIFSEFSRLPNADQEKTGLGLGLSIVDRITRLLNHPVRVASVLGRGSTFTVEVPRTPALASVTIAPALKVVVAPQRQTSQGVSVLVIDNDPTILDSMRTLLTGWGCVVHSAGGIKAALDVLFSGDVQPVLVFADYHLDDGNGLDAVSAVRVRLGLNIPAVLITADTSAELAREARLFGCVLLRKPVRPAQVRSLVNQFALQHEAAAE